MKNAYGTFLMGVYVENLEIDYNNGETENEALQRVVKNALECSGVRCDWIERTTNVVNIKENHDD